VIIRSRGRLSRLGAELALAFLQMAGGADPGGQRWCAAPAATAIPALDVAARRTGGIAPGAGTAMPAGAAHGGGPSGGRELVEDTEPSPPQYLVSENTA